MRLKCECKLNPLNEYKELLGLFFTSKMFTCQVAMHCKPVLLSNYKVCIYVYVYYMFIILVF